MNKINKRIKELRKLYEQLDYSDLQGICMAIAQETGYHQNDLLNYAQREISLAELKEYDKLIDGDVKL